MASTKTDSSRGTYSNPEYSNVISVKQSSAKVLDADLNALFNEQRNNIGRLHVVMNSSEKILKREIPFSVKQELQRSFYEQVNKLLE